MEVWTILHGPPRCALLQVPSAPSTHRSWLQRWAAAIQDQRQCHLRHASLASPLLRATSFALPANTCPTLCTPDPSVISNNGSACQFLARGDRGEKAETETTGSGGGPGLRQACACKLVERAGERPQPALQITIIPWKAGNCFPGFPSVTGTIFFFFDHLKHTS